MIRNLKALGLAALAVMAMGAIAASAAQAAEFTAAEYPVTFGGTNEAGSEVFSTEAGEVNCASSFEGSAGAASTTVTVAPSYSECEAFGFLNATVNTEECHYLFHLGEQTGEHEFDATVDVDCPEGQSIKITAFTCSAEVGSQTGLSNVTLTETTGSSDIDVLANVTGIAYTVTNDGFLCPFSGTGAKEGGEYKTNAESPLTITGSSALDIG